MSVLSVAEARASGVTGEDAAIQLSIDDVEAEIVDRFGPYSPGPVTELLSPAYRSSVLVLRRKIVSVDSILEWETSNVIGGVSVTLDPTDFRIRAGFQLERLATGLNPRSYWLPWGVEVTYVPVDDTPRRKAATVAVLKLELGSTGAGGGLTGRRIGDYEESYGGASTSTSASTATADRLSILRRLRPRGIVFA